MKTLFALLGLFMFASVSSTDISSNNTIANESVLTETSDGTIGGAKRGMIITYETSDGTIGGAKRGMIITYETSDGTIGGAKRGMIIT
ncbi:hypothetical protein [Flavobacterium lacus]|uniref:Uncharacterized protein n=1 Tax=Flavobacterium lacus TaxID=1353778 RepID=A0A328WK35_9FLAO|nr:hypothetical protein [Flavobacterium lacus]RAR46712.1 hypothetical protein B0I10_11520 [Flavobacterium lacus]